MPGRSHMLLATEPLVGSARLAGCTVVVSAPKFARAVAAGPPSREGPSGSSEKAQGRQVAPLAGAGPLGVAPPPGLEEDDAAAGGLAGGLSLLPACLAAELKDSEVSSDCSTADTAAAPSVATDPSTAAAAVPLEAPHGAAGPARGLALVAVAGSPVPVLRLDAAIAEPSLGSPERPTIGSSHHRLGICKPCAHAFKKEGCHNGIDCKFCHLCEPGELKKRKKERQSHQRNTQKLQPQQLHLSAAVPTWGLPPMI